MKKTAALVLAILLLVSPAALAASDLSGMTVDQLLALRSGIDAELLARGELKSFSVPPGEYEVGIDFPAGKYSLSLKDPTAHMASVYTHESEAAFRDGGYDRSFTMRSEGEASVGKVTLYDGEFIEVKFSSVVFELYTGIKFPQQN